MEDERMLYVHRWRESRKYRFISMLHLRIQDEVTRYSNVKKILICLSEDNSSFLAPVLGVKGIKPSDFVEMVVKRCGEDIYDEDACVMVKFKYSKGFQTIKIEFLSVTFVGSYLSSLYMNADGIIDVEYWFKCCKLGLLWDILCSCMHVRRTYRRRRVMFNVE